jgi:hypothetical protein
MSNQLGIYIIHAVQAVEEEDRAFFFGLGDDIRHLKWLLQQLARR